MSVPLIKPAFTLGELSPGLFGRTDLARYHIGAGTMRNMFVSYRGGAYSRAGTAFVGFSKQTGRDVPPRMITFQFSVKQGLALEFGNFYMRVVSNGAFITENSIPITDATQTDPVTITSSGIGAFSATPNNGAVATSYVTGDQITLAGGTFSSPAVLSVTNTELVGLTTNVIGTAGVYAPGNTITLAGGTHSVAAQLTLATTQVVSATIAAPGAGGTNGVQTVTGTTGTGTKFQALVTIAGGAITSVNSISVRGNYSVNPAVPAAEPVTGAGAGAELNLVIGVRTFTITTPGVYTVNPAGGAMTQAATSGTGVGASFQSAVMAPHTVGVVTPGVYTVFPANPVAQASSTGSGLGVTFNVTNAGTAAFAVGDWIAIDGMLGMTELNGETVVVSGAVGDVFSLSDVYGNPIDGTAFTPYTGGGTASRIFTVVTPYAEADLKYLKVTQSADTMTICLVNQETLTEYQAQDLQRISNTNWQFTPVVATPTVTPPVSGTATATSAGTTNYQYEVTSVSPVDGTESIASDPIGVSNAVNIAATAGTITVTWPFVAGVNQYNVYKTFPSTTVPVPVGSQFGYVGFTYGTQFNDSNVQPDFSQTPPTRQNPFARGQVLSGVPTSGGAGYTTITLTVTSGTGTGAKLTGVLVGGVLSGVIVDEHGELYAPGDPVVVTGDGTGAAASVAIGPQSGTYPGVVAYFQERRAYAFTLNNPDTYFMSGPGAFKNFDTRNPSLDSDAITGSPWSVQVDGIQWMLNMPGGLVVFTGSGAWQLTGTGGSSFNPQPITPSTQQAQPQAYNGISPTVPPIKIAGEIIYVQNLESIYNAFQYQYAINIYDISDITVNSTHLFDGFGVVEHAWCESPLKVLWSVRSDGVLLSDTYFKKQEVNGWARHDTQGLFKSVCSVIESPVYALYAAVLRYPGNNTAYMIERMDDRLWADVESCWCVDAGLRLDQPMPAATLRASSAAGLGAITGTIDLVGGSGYSAGTTAQVVDDNGEGPGTGAVPTITIAGGVITSVTFAPADQGVNYTQPRIDFLDPANTGSGASATAVLDNSATFTADSPVFTGTDVDSVIRMGGGIATITAFISAEVVTAQITSPIVEVIPDGPEDAQTPLPQVAGDWTMTKPVASISGLTHLAGMTVTGVADGNVVPPTLVPPTGVIALPSPASAVTIGLGFTAQVQSMYLDTGEPTVQGARKKVGAVTLRIKDSREFLTGANQPDGSTLSPPQNAPLWQDLTEAPSDGPNFPPKPYNATATPLRTGDIRVTLAGGWDTKGQVCAQQSNPLPLQILAMVNEVLPGDNPAIKAPGQQQRATQAAR